MALFRRLFQRERESKKIIIFLTRGPPQLPPPQVTASRSSSYKYMNLLSFFCHAADMSQPCALTIAAPKTQRKSPAKTPGSIKIA
jgi:hypothetical protein